MSSSDAQKYQESGANRPKMVYDIEAQSCKDFAAFQKTTAAVGHGSVSASHPLPRNSE